MYIIIGTYLYIQYTWNTRALCVKRKKITTTQQYYMYNNIHRTSKNFVVFFRGGRIVRMYTYITCALYWPTLIVTNIMYIYNIIIIIKYSRHEFYYYSFNRFKYARARVSPVALTCTECVGRITWMASPLYVGTVYTIHTHTHISLIRITQKTFVQVFSSSLFSALFLAERRTIAPLLNGIYL